MKNDSYRIVRDFLLTEGMVYNDLENYVQGVIDNLNLIRPSTKTDERRLNLVRDQLVVVKRLVKKMKPEEEITPSEED